MLKKMLEELNINFATYIFSTNKSLFFSRELLKMLQRNNSTNLYHMNCIKINKHFKLFCSDLTTQKNVPVD